MDRHVKQRLIEFLLEMGFTRKTLNMLTDDQIASLAFEKACELMKP